MVYFVRMYPIFVGLTSYQKFLWGCSFGCNDLLIFICLITKFQNSHRITWCTLWLGTRHIPRLILNHLGLIKCWHSSFCNFLFGSFVLHINIWKIAFLKICFQGKIQGWLLRKFGLILYLELTVKDAFLSIFNCKQLFAEKMPRKICKIIRDVEIKKIIKYMDYSRIFFCKCDYYSLNHDKISNFFKISLQ